MSPTLDGNAPHYSTMSRTQNNTCDGRQQRKRTPCHCDPVDARVHTNHQSMSFPNFDTCSPETAVDYINYICANRDPITGKMSNKAFNFEEGIMPAEFPPADYGFTPGFIASTVEKGEEEGVFLVNTEPPAVAMKPIAAKQMKTNKRTYKQTPKVNRNTIAYRAVPHRRRGKSKIVYAKTNYVSVDARFKAQKLAEAQKAAAAKNKETIASDKIVAMQFHMEYLDSVHVKIKVNKGYKAVPPRPVAGSTNTTIKIEKLDPTAATITKIKIDSK